MIEGLFLLILIPVISYELFKYKAEIPITLETLTSMKVDHVKISVDTESLISRNMLQDDCKDLIFRKSFNDTVPHWIEYGCNTNQTWIWLHINDSISLPPRMINLTMHTGNIFYEEDPEYENSKMVDGVVFYFFTFQECPPTLDIENVMTEERYVRISTTTSNELGGNLYHNHFVRYRQSSTDPSKVTSCTETGGIEGTPYPHVHHSNNETNDFENEFPHFNLFFCPSLSLDVPSQSVLPMNKSTPPSGMKEMESVKSRFLRITSDEENIGTSDYSSWNHSHILPSTFTNRSVISVTLADGDVVISASDHFHLIEATNSDLSNNITLPHLRIPFYEFLEEEDRYIPKPKLFVLYTSPTENNKHKSIPGIRFLEDSSFDGKFLLGHDEYDMNFNLYSDESKTISSEHTHQVENKFMNTTTSIMYYGDPSTTSPECQSGSDVEVMNDLHTHEFEVEIMSSSHIPPFFSVFIGEKYEPEYLEDTTFEVHMDEMIDHGWECFGVEFDRPDYVCSGRGRCVREDVCVCPDYVMGADCSETIGDGEYTLDYSRIWIHYKILIRSLERFVPDALKPFECSRIVENIDTLGRDSMCWFEAKNSLMTTSRLIIVDCNEDVQIVKLHPITKHSTVVDSYINKYTKVPGIEAYTYIVPTAVGVPCLLCLCVICCCAIFILCCVVWKIIVRVCKLWRYRSISKAELGGLLEEKEMEEKEGNVAKLRINSALFEINYDDIRVVDAIGEGGSNSTVFKAKWKGQTVAFKCFKTTTVCSDQAVFMEFEREVEILSSVSHPHVLSFYGATLKPPRVGIVMEFCKYGDLTIFFTKEGQLFPFIERLRILKEIASAMSYLHSNNIIHRDLKPENVLLNKAFECKVMDFGLSRMMDEMSSAKTVRIGTSMYMAPEVVKGSKYDQRCDVFSFGVIIYCVVTNDFHPYDFEDGEFAVEMRVANDPDFRPQVTEKLVKEEFCDNEWLVSCMKSCWEDDPDDRPSFDEVNDSLTEHKKEQIKKFENKKGSDEEEEQVFMTQEELWNTQSKIREMREKLEELHELKMENERLEEKVEKLREERRLEEVAEKKRRREEKRRKRREKEGQASPDLSNLIGGGPITQSLRFQLNQEKEKGRAVKSVDISARIRNHKKKKETETDGEPTTTRNESEDFEMSEEMKNKWKNILSSAKRESSVKKKRGTSDDRKKIVFADLLKSNDNDDDDNNNNDNNNLLEVEEDLRVRARRKSEDELELTIPPGKKRVRFKLDDKDDELEKIGSDDDDDDDGKSSDDDDDDESDDDSTDEEKEKRVRGKEKDSEEEDSSSEAGASTDSSSSSSETSD